MTNPLPLHSPSFPFVLLPVKIETRFHPVETPTMLKVRIFPQQIMVDAHQIALQPFEYEAGIRYWRNSRAGAEAEKDAWRALLDGFTAPRAAYIVEQTKPNSSSASPSYEDVRGDYAPITAVCLPDYWIAFGYRNGQIVARERSNPVQKPLALAIDSIPVDPSEQPSDAVGAILDSEQLSWIFRYDRAHTIGMAITFDPLTPEDVVNGFDTIIVLGIFGQGDAVVSAGELERLLNAHRNTLGTAFVPQGTPTNNTAKARSGYPPQDPHADRSFHVARNGLEVVDGTDGAEMAAALGIPRNTFTHVEGADGQEQHRARQMNNALWPVTLGYFLEQMGAPGTDVQGASLFTREIIGEARAHFVAYVHGRGTLPIFRIGGMPYGVLPVTALSHWPQALDVDFVASLNKLRTLLLNPQGGIIDSIDRILPNSETPDADLLRILAMDASAREVYVRAVFGGLLSRGMALHMPGLVFEDEQAWEMWIVEQRINLSNFLKLVGLENIAPRLAELIFDARRYPYRYPQEYRPDPVTGQYHYGLVGSGGSGELSETEPLEEGSNYILDLIDTPPVQLLETEGLNDWLTGEDPLLAVLLRHALLLEYADALYNLLEEAQLPLPRRREPELLGISRSPTPYTAWRLFHEPDPAERTRTIARRLYEERFARMGSYLESLNSLANVPTAELHRLLTETLDTVSHRIDAWITSVAARRLDEMRANETLGCHLGAFGWLEHVRPNGTSTAFSGGFVHAPSTAQATAAAVLASASQTHQFKVRLSSRSVRAGLSLIEGLRAGLPIGAMLGVHVEHTLFERDLARYVAPLRAIYPLVPSNPNVPTETPVALNVVDGLALRRSWLDDTFDWEQEGLPNTNEEEFDRLFSALNEVFGKGEGEKIDAVDAMTDLLTAESVYQMILGNQDSANAAFNALTRDGTTPPIPQVVQTPHRHIDITHRVALLLDEREPEGWRTTRTPRAEVEPILDGWVGNLFGDPKDIFASVTIPTPTQTDLKARQIVDVSLEALEVRPLDILFMTDGELNARITTAALVELNELDLDVRGARVNEAPADRSRTLSDIRALSTALKAALGGGRSFRPTDLSPMNIESDKAVQRSALQRVSTAITRVESLVADLNEYTVTVEETIEAADNIDGVRIDTSDLRNALSQAALYGVEGVFPNTLASQEGDQVSVARTFVELAKGAMNKLNQRLNEVGQINRNEVNAAERIAATLFGSFVLLPRIANPDWPAYEEAPHPYIADTEFESRYRVDQWATQVSHAHSLMSSWMQVWRIGRMLGARPALEVIQFPSSNRNFAERWIGLDFGSAGEYVYPKEGHVSLVIYRDTTETSPVAGLLIDEWAERIRVNEEVTSIAINYNAPASQSPQVILVVVPPPGTTQWSEELLMETLYDTLDLAKLRAVDSDLLQSISPMETLFPAILLAANLETDGRADQDGVISTDFTHLRRNT